MPVQQMILQALIFGAVVSLPFGAALWYVMHRLKCHRVGALRRVPAYREPLAEHPHPTRVRLSSKCRSDVHARVLEGGGGLDDAMTCVECGRHQYPENFGLYVELRKRPVHKSGQYFPVISRTEREHAWRLAR